MRAEAVAGALGVEVDHAEELLNQLKADELVHYREGRVSGWRTTTSGTERHAELLVHDLLADRAQRIETEHHAFVPLNARFKQTCTDWQLRNGEINDHSDAAYDEQVVAALASIDDDLGPVLEGLGKVLHRFTMYQPRLADALGRVRAGDRRAFAAPLSESYHDIWMELHQDLILSLRLTRSEADS